MRYRKKKKKREKGKLEIGQFLYSNFRRGNFSLPWAGGSSSNPAFQPVTCEYSSAKVA